MGTCMQGISEVLSPKVILAPHAADAPFDPVQRQNLISELSKELVDMIVKKLHLDNKGLIVLASTSLTTSVVAFVVSIVNVCINETTVLSRWVMPLLSLLSVAQQIAILVSLTTKEEFHFETIHEFIYTLINEYTMEGPPSLDTIVASEMRHPNSFDPQYILSLVSHLITWTMGVGAGLFGWDVRSLNGILTMREKMVTLSRDTQELASSLLKSIFDYDIGLTSAVSNKISKLVMKTGEMVRTPAVSYLADTTKVTLLEECLKEIEQLQTATMTPDQTRAYGSARSQLNHNYTQLSQMHATISSLAASQDRPVTICVVLKGLPGIGKSNAATYIMRQVADALGFSKNIYNLEMGVHGTYCEIYRKQALGIYNEFGKMKDNANALYSINSILSNDPLNFEAADLAFKHQACVLRLVMLTTNRVDLNFLKDITEGANVAFITRVMEVTLTDPKFEGRGQPNAHRKPDFSHLKFTWEKLKNLTPERFDHTKPRTKVDMNIFQLLDLLKYRVSQEETNFLTTQMNNNPDYSPVIKEGMMERINQLKQFNTAPVPNAANTSFFVARWQGPPGTGKTTASRCVSKTLKSAFLMETVYMDDPTFPVYQGEKVPTLFVVDDISITPENARAYHVWINTLPPNSCVLLLTNDIVPPEPIPRSSFRHFAKSFNVGDTNLWKSLYPREFVRSIVNYTSTPSIKAYHITKYMGDVLKTAPGLSRRLGFNGLQLIDGEFVDPPSDSGICLTTGLTSYIGLEPVHYCDLALETTTAFATWLRRSDGFVWVNHPLPTVSWDIWIEIRDFNVYRERVKSSSGYRSMFSKDNDPGGKIHIRPASIDTFLASTDVATWIMPNIGDADNFFQSAETFLYRLVNAYPTVVCKLTYGSCALLYSDGVVHRDDNAGSSATDPVAIIDDILYYNETPIVPTEIAEILVNGVKSGRPMAMPKLSVMAISEILAHLKAHKHEPEYHLYATAVDDLVAKMKMGQNWKDSHIYKWLMTDSTLRNVLVALLGGVTTIGIIYGVTKMFSKPKVSDEYLRYLKEHTAPNTFETNGERERPQARKQEAYERARGPQHKGGKTSGARYGEFGTTYVQPLLRGMHANSSEETSSDEQPTDVPTPARALQFDNMSREELLTILKRQAEPMPNMVAPTPALPSNPRLEAIVARLRTNVARVVADHNLCHGLFLCGRYVLTVKHTIYDTKDINVIWRPSEQFEEKSYPARVVYQDHARDIAILLVTDKTCPEAPSIVKYITWEDEITAFRDDSIFVRPFTNTEIVYGQVFYNDKYSVPLGRTGDPKWSPTMYYDYISYHLSTGVHQVRNGDCGLPLLRCIGSEYFIIGINCAKGVLGEANFSMINRQLLQGVLASTPNSIQLHVHKCDQCGKWYSHTHNMSRPDHKQRPYQCPNKECPWYGEDDTNSVLVDGPFEREDVENSEWLEGHLDIPPYNKIMTDVVPKTDYDNHERLPILGFSRNMRLISNPRHSRKFCRPPGVDLVSTSLPSVLKESDLTPSAHENLPKTASGKPSILLRQALKTVNRLPMKLSAEEFCMYAEWTAEWCALHFGDKHKPLRTHEVINGMIDAPVRSMRMSTSAGPYFKIQYGITDKTHLFKVTSAPNAPVVIRSFADTPAGLELERLYMASIKAIEKGLPVSVVIKDNIKVELLPQEKVLMGESRLFCECDIHFNMILRRYTASFLGAMADNHMFSGIAIGMNPYLFPNYTDSHAPRHYDTICSDLKSMDKTLHSWYLQLYFSCILRCSDKEYFSPECAHALYESLATTLHVQGGILYFTDGTNPSGIYGTAPLNSIAVIHVLMRLYWKAAVATSLRNVFTLHDFDTLMRHEILGDDTRLRVDPALKLTFDDLKEAFADCGLNCVPSKTPGGELGDFCSRAYFRDTNEGVTFGALKKDTIIDLVLWVEAGSREIMVSNYHLAMFEACMWDEKFYDSIVSAVKTAAEYFNLPKGRMVYFPYKVYRKHLAKYIRGEVTSPMLTDMEPSDPYLDLDTSPTMSQRNYVGLLLEFHAKLGLPFVPTYVETRDSASGEWLYALTFNGDTFVGKGARKSEAKNDAYGQAYSAKVSAATQPNAIAPGSWHKHSLRYRTEPNSRGNGRVLAIYADDVRLHELPLEPRPENDDETPLLSMNYVLPLYLNFEHLDDEEDITVKVSLQSPQ